MTKQAYENLSYDQQMLVDRAVEKKLWDLKREDDPALFDAFQKINDREIRIEQNRNGLTVPPVAVELVNARDAKRVADYIATQRDAFSQRGDPMTPGNLDHLEMVHAAQQAIGPNPAPISADEEARHDAYNLETGHKEVNNFAHINKVWDGTGPNPNAGLPKETVPGRGYNVIN